MKKLENKVALITGASRGIGRSIALLFAQAGCDIILNYRQSQDKAASLKQQIQDTGVNIHTVQCDVTDRVAIERMKDEVIQRYQKIDILVNNAGAYGIERFNQVGEAAARAYFDANYFATFNTIQIFKPYLSDPGVIINIGSISGMVTSASNPAYGNAKAAVQHLTKTLALEFAPTIRVNAIAPGWVDTDMSLNIDASFREREMGHIPLKRFCQPGEIARAALFLAADDSNYITGQILVIDGGYSLK